MTIREFYEKVNGNFDEVLSRLMTEERIHKYLIRFTEADDMDLTESSVRVQNWEEAFRGSHSMKGMCLNLGIEKLRASSSELCEACRNGEPSIDVSPLLENMKKDYEETIGLIDQID